MLMTSCLRVVVIVCCFRAALSQGSCPHNETCGLQGGAMLQVHALQKTSDGVSGDRTASAALEAEPEKRVSENGYAFSRDEYIAYYHPREEALKRWDQASWATPSGYKKVGYGVCRGFGTTPNDDSVDTDDVEDCARQCSEKGDDCVAIEWRSSGDCELYKYKPTRVNTRSDAMCYKKTAILGQPNSNSCPGGSQGITTMADCETAARDLGNFRTESKSDRPRGCSLQWEMVQDPNVYWNEHATGLGSSGRQVICKEARPTPSPTPRFVPPSTHPTPTTPRRPTPSATPCDDKPHGNSCQNSENTDTGGTCNEKPYPLSLKCSLARGNVTCCSEKCHCQQGHSLESTDLFTVVGLRPYFKLKYCVPDKKCYEEEKKWMACVKGGNQKPCADNYFYLGMPYTKPTRIFNIKVSWNPFFFTDKFWCQTVDGDLGVLLEGDSCQVNDTSLAPSSR